MMVDGENYIQLKSNNHEHRRHLNQLLLHIKGKYGLLRVSATKFCGSLIEKNPRDSSATVLYWGLILCLFVTRLLNALRIVNS